MTGFSTSAEVIVRVKSKRQSPTKALFMTPVTQIIIFVQNTLFLGSNYFLITRICLGSSNGFALPALTNHIELSGKASGWFFVRFGAGLYECSTCATVVKLPRLVIKGILVTLFGTITGKVILRFSRSQKKL